MRRPFIAADDGRRRSTRARRLRRRRRQRLDVGRQHRRHDRHRLALRAAEPEQHAGRRPGHHRGVQRQRLRGPVPAHRRRRGRAAARRGLRGQRRRPHLHDHAPRGRHLPLRQGADLRRREVQRRGRHRRGLQVGPQVELRHDRRHRDARRPHGGLHARRALDLVPLQPQLRLDRQHRRRRPDRDGRRHRPVHARRVAPGQHPDPHALRRLLGRARPRTPRSSSPTSPTPRPRTTRCSPARSTSSPASRAPTR